jgi:hypothetical protein
VIWINGSSFLVAPIVQPSHLSGFYGNLECLKNISDIQCKTGKPITIPTANVAIK